MTTEQEGTCSACGATLVNEDCPNYGFAAEHAKSPIRDAEQTGDNA